MVNQFYEKYKDKTRVLVISSEDELGKILLHIIQAQEKEVDFYFSNENQSDNDNDFFILKLNNTENAAQFQPTIVFLATDANHPHDASLIQNITGGGILIYNEENETLAEIVDNTENYFRKSAFKINPNKSGVLETDLGAIPVKINENSQKYIDGLRELCQHIGIMEEDFYSHLVSF